MKTRRSSAVGLLALSAGAAALPALAGDDCDVPTQRWQSREAVRQMAAQKGWELERLKINDGCWEIRGRDAEGRRFKAKLDPETLEVVKMKRGDRDRDQERKREHDARGAAPQAAASAPTPSPLFTPGTAPRGQID